MPSTLTRCAASGRELGAGREQGGEVKDRVDLVGAGDALDHVAVEDVADDGGFNARTQRRVKFGNVQREDVVLAGRAQLID